MDKENAQCTEACISPPNVQNKQNRVRGTHFTGQGCFEPIQKQTAIKNHMNLYENPIPVHGSKY